MIPCPLHRRSSRAAKFRRVRLLRQRSRQEEVAYQMAHATTTMISAYPSQGYCAAHALTAASTSLTATSCLTLAAHSVRKKRRLGRYDHTPVGILEASRVIHARLGPVQRPARDTFLRYEPLVRLVNLSWFRFIAHEPD